MKEAAGHTDLEVILTFISSTLWPAAFLITILLFRKQFVLLLQRLSSFKFGDTEVAFQAGAPDEKAAPAKLVHASTAPSGFLTDSSIRSVIKDSGLTGGDEVYRTMQIFRTTNQATWLAFSKSKVFCLLDDENTRKSGRLIQWVLPKSAAKPIVTRQKNATVGLIDVGQRSSWLYSLNLFPDPEMLKTEVEAALAEQS